jgi:DNA-3-methyladenine glycosylase
MFGPPGHAYVYLVYGLHCLLNVVSETDGVPGAILLRAIQPRLGIERMADRRGLVATPADPALLAAGPARLTQALAVDRDLNGVDLTKPGGLFIGDPGAVGLRAARAGGILEGPRVGIGYAGEPWTTIPWRFGLAGSRSLSRRFARGAPPSSPARP